MALDGEQETLTQISNLVIDAFAIDSAIARTQQRAAAGGDETITSAICTVAAIEALDRASATARRVLENAFAGDELAPWLSKASQLGAHVPAALLPLRRAIAKKAVDDLGYKLSSY